ncbi:MAG: hypothetical protein GY765_38735 [bacterium]|nr:hypothetical protein [bacterium]
MQEDHELLTQKKIFKFWYPLAASWLMMSVEAPFVSAIIARLVEAKFNLAAFGVAYSFALILEAPIIMLMSASTALCKDRESFHKLHRFSMGLNMAVTGAMLVVLIPPVFHAITVSLIGLPHRVAYLTHISLTILLPWPAAIGYRRFYQGILIRSGLTRYVAYCTVVRVVAMAVTAIVLFRFKVTGAYVGAAALSAGISCEALVCRILVHDSLKKMKAAAPTIKNQREPLTYHLIWAFYYPLMIMTTLSLGVHPMVTFFVGKSRFAIESLAILPVINALGFIFRSVGLSYTEVVIALLGDKNRNYIPLRNFAINMSIIVTAGLGLIAFTPLAKVWFHHISGLSLELASFAYLPTQITILLPALSVMISLQRSILVTNKVTGPISWATCIEVGFILSALYFGIVRLDMVGATAATAAYVIAKLCANIYLVPHRLKVLK